VANFCIAVLKLKFVDLAMSLHVYAFSLDGYDEATKLARERCSSTA
jgi:hypothetical protein